MASRSFTYGPLGFLGFAHPYVGMTSTLAFVAAIAIYMALICTMLLQASRISLFMGRRPDDGRGRQDLRCAPPPFEASLALACVWFVLALADQIPLPPSAFAAITGVMAGAAMLGKVNVASSSSLSGWVTVAIVGRPLWRPLGTYAAATAATVLILWLLATGQHNADLGCVWVYQIIAATTTRWVAIPSRSGHGSTLPSPALARSSSGPAGRACDWPRSRRIGLAILGLVFAFAMLKTAVVREHATWSSRPPLS